MSDVITIHRPNRHDQQERFRLAFSRRFEGEDEPSLTHCPGHDDENPSCTISPGETPGTLYLHCMTPTCSDRHVWEAAISIGIDAAHLATRKAPQKTADIVMPVPQAYADDFPYATGDDCTVTVTEGHNKDGEPILVRYPGIATVTKYKNEHSQLNFAVVRMDYSDGEGRPAKLPRIMVLAKGQFDTRDWTWGWPDPGVQRTALNLKYLVGTEPSKPIGIVEGEKTFAATVDPTHPWASYFSQYVWTTYAGGVSSIGNTDWSWCRGRDIYLFPDNDPQGKEGFRQLAILLVNTGARSVYIMDHELPDYPAPDKWDFADKPWPLQRSRKGRRKPKKTDETPVVSWTEISDALVPVDRPFREIWIQDADGMPTLDHELRTEFVEQWAHLRAEDVMVYRQRPTIRFTRSMFNNAMAQQYAPQDVWQAMISRPDLTQADRLGYRPGEPTGKLFTNKADGAVCINSYRPPTLTPQLGSIRPALYFMRHLIPDYPERKILIRRLAMLVGLPNERRLTWAVLLISEMQGVGKTILMMAVSHLVGNQNTHKLDPDLLMKDNFNGWVESYLLILIEELREGPSYKAPEKLKDAITNPTGSVRRMRVSGETCEYHTNFIASSNHPGAANVSTKDRRWFVPKVTENDTITDRHLVKYAGKRSPFEWIVYWFYRRDGASFVLHCAQDYADLCLYKIDTAEGIKKGLSSKSPMTDAKKLMIQSAKPEWFRDLMEVLNALPEGAVVTLEDIRHYIKHRLDDPKFKRETLKFLLDEEGWICPWPKVEALTDNQIRGRIQYRDQTKDRKRSSKTVLSKARYWFNSWREEVPDGYGTATDMRNNTWWLMNYNTDNAGEKLYDRGHWFEDKRPGEEPEDD